MRSIAQLIDARKCLVLDDGRYDAFIVWASQRGDALVLECTITTGAHRGDVIDIVSPPDVQIGGAHARDPIDLVGLPCTIVVAGDAIRVEE